MIKKVDINFYKISPHIRFFCLASILVLYASNYNAWIRTVGCLVYRAVLFKWELQFRNSQTPGWISKCSLQHILTHITFVGDFVTSLKVIRAIKYLQPKTILEKKMRCKAFLFLKVFHPCILTHRKTICKCWTSDSTYTQEMQCRECPDRKKTIYLLEEVGNSSKTRPNNFYLAHIKMNWK